MMLLLLGGGRRVALVCAAMHVFEMIVFGRCLIGGYPRLSESKRRLHAIRLSLAS